jgi:23S rRNA (uracil1939-C5)-methyltransferase
MTTGEIFSSRIEGIVAGGAGLARFEGMPVFVELTAPHDMVRARITAVHRSWARGELVEILEPSPLRVQPLCSLYGICGGCSLQHIHYEAQISAKTAILKEAFIRIGGLPPPEPKIIRSQPWEYRNRVQFHCTPQFHSTSQAHCSPQDTQAPGFKSRKSDAVIALHDCPVADPGLRSALQNGSITMPGGKERFTVYSRSGVFLVEGGAERGTVKILGKNLAMSAGVFFQSNGALLETLIGDILAIAEGADNLLPAADLYCGVGTFAAFLKDRFAHIDLMEENKAALALARENTGADGKEYYALSDEAWAKLKLTGKKGSGAQPSEYGFILADPPRQGLSSTLKRYLCGCAGKGLILAYVSCDPAALARDSRELAAGGYTLHELRLYDFYPQTAHIESLAIFKK